MGYNTTNIQLLGGTVQQGWATKLDSASSTALEKKGIVRWDVHPNLGWRGFQYLRCDQSGGMSAGDLATQIANVSINNITAGTTTSITTSGLTANIYVDGILYCLDDAGAAGAAPEGESGRIISNTATKVSIHSDDAFSVSTAVNDDFEIHIPWAVGDAAVNDQARRVLGVSMADLSQYQYGWFQFYGLNPRVLAVAAGTALTKNEACVAGNGGLVTDGSTAAAELRIGTTVVGLTSDTVRRYAHVDLFCGAAFKLTASA